ncbi:hypothetical protein F5B19DRAFT_499403 [Rostrohypoxylon terebratum]|nr:hypothetical protein F5B19DRAFT_499403 [Rostrohypoxylon terebratum]
MGSEEWLTSHFLFTTPEDVVAIGISFPIICIVLITLRFYARRQYGTYIRIDDWLSAIGVVMITAIGGCMITGERRGYIGYPTPIPPGATRAQAYTQFLLSHPLEAKIEFAAQVLTCFAHGCIKTSIVFFSRRIFVCNKNSTFNKASWILVIISMIWSLSFLLSLLIGCGKTSSLRWAPIESIQIWALNMSPRKKIATTGVFLVGLLSLGAAIARMAMVFTVSHNNHEMDYDMNQTVTAMLWLGMLEASLAEVASCLPTLYILTKDVKFRNFYFRLGNSTGLFSLWTKASNGRQWPRLGADTVQSDSYGFSSMGPGAPKGKIVIERQISITRNEPFV